jgi:putative Holliday junction resolvase
LYHLKEMPSRVLGVDVGRKRIGLAISDASGTLARPLQTLTLTGDDGIDVTAGIIGRLQEEEDGLQAVVVGVPVRLDGTANEQTSYVTSFIRRLESRVTVPIVPAEERLSSREAESRLALREPDWRKRKARLDAAAAAVILQDYLDGAVR